MSKPSYAVPDVKRAFAEENITLLAREDVERHPPPTEGPVILLSMTPRVMTAVCETSAAAQAMNITSVFILGGGATQEKAKQVEANVAAFWPSQDAATGARISRALNRLARGRL